MSAHRGRLFTGRPFAFVEGSKTPIRQLWVSFGASYIIVHQATEDGEAKSFLYKLSDIVGRVEIAEVSL